MANPSTVLPTRTLQQPESCRSSPLHVAMRTPSHLRNSTVKDNLGVPNLQLYQDCNFCHCILSNATSKASILSRSDSNVTKLFPCVFHAFFWIKALQAGKNQRPEPAELDISGGAYQVNCTWRLEISWTHTVKPVVRRGPFLGPLRLGAMLLERAR